MDPVSHVSLGRALAGVLSPRDSDRSMRGTIAACVLGALSPDLDAILMPFGWDRYLRVHEIGSHSILGTVGCALLTAAAVKIVTRSQYKTLAFYAWVGAISHVLLDLLSSARLRPGWPIVDTVVSLPAVAMADPWLLALCAAGGLCFWLFNDARAARIVLAVTTIFLLAKAAAGTVAVSAYRVERDRAAVPVHARAIEAEWGSLTRWRVLDRTPSQLRIWRAATGQPATLSFSWPLEHEDELITKSRGLSTVRNFLMAHELVFAGVVAAPGNGSYVLWSDIRFCWNPDAPSAPQLEPFVRSREAGRIACGLWFGGEFDAAGNPVREVVKIGRFTQTR
jgi:membrane-bound metal-dependent hydrolase YbcI (DUF457 family)